jgi:hypothetical protein
MIRLVSAVCALAVPIASFADEPAPPPADLAEPPLMVEPPLTVDPPPRSREDASPIPRRSKDITIEVPGERSRDNKLLVGGLAAGGVLVSALAVYWHLDSRDASNEVSADEPTGKAWTDEQLGLVDRADRSRTRAIVAYSLGGAILIGTIVTYIITAPKSETTVIHTGVAVGPVEHGNGGMVTKLWSF